MAPCDFPAAPKRLAHCAGPDTNRTMQRCLRPGRVGRFPTADRTPPSRRLLLPLGQGAPRCILSGPFAEGLHLRCRKAPTVETFGVWSGDAKRIGCKPVIS